MSEPSVADCENYLRDQLGIIGNVPANRMSNYFLARRDVLLYSYIMQTIQHVPSISVDALVHLIGSASGTVIEDRLLELRSKEFIKLENDQAYDFILTKNMIKAIETVFGEQYGLLDPIAYFPQEVTGCKLVGYFSKIINPPPMSLSDMILSALQLALGHHIETRVLDRKRGIYLLSRPNQWNLMIYAVTNDGAVSETDLNAYVVDMMSVRGRNTWDGLLFSTNSENIEVYRRAAQLHGLNNVWSVTAVRFFNHLKQRVDSFGAELVAESFDAIIAPEGEAFGVRDAMRRLELKIQQLSGH